MVMKAIPVAIRERILKLCDQGRGTVEIAASFGYCVAAVRRVRQHFKARGTLEPQTRRCGRKTHLTVSRKARLLALLERRPDATLAELGTPLERPTSTIDLWLTRLGWSCKKTLPAAEQSRPDVAEQRTQSPHGQHLDGAGNVRVARPSADAGRDQQGLFQKYPRQGFAGLKLCLYPRRVQ